jgi:hypothetical protein
MQHFGGKDSKRHFTVVMGGKEHGLYVSSTPSSAAKKAVTKLCAANKSKKVEFEIREITQGSKKKTYGPYSGYIEKLKQPIELKGRVIKYKPVAKLRGKTGAKKGGMRGGGNYVDVLKIEKNDSELNFDDLCKDYHFTPALDNITINSLEKAQSWKNGTITVFGYPNFVIFTALKKNPKNTYIEKNRNFNLGVKNLQILLTKYGGINSSFSIYISENKRPYDIIEGQTAETYRAIPIDEISENNRYLLENTSDMEKPKPLGFPASSHVIAQAIWNARQAIWNASQAKNN